MTFFKKKGGLLLGKDAMASFVPLRHGGLLTSLERLSRVAEGHHTECDAKRSLQA